MDRAVWVECIALRYGSEWAGRLRLAGNALFAAAAAGLIGGCAADQFDPFLKKSQMQVNAQPAGSRPPVSVVMRPVTGAPDAVSKEYIRQLNTAAASKDIALLADADAKAPLTLYSYLLVERSGDGVKLLYVSDVTNAAGEKVRRVSGEDLVPAPASGDIWTAVTAERTRPIAEKAIAALDEAAQR